MVTVPRAASAARSASSIRGSAAAAAGPCARAAGACRRTTRTRRPPLSTSSSARSWAIARSTTCLGVHCSPAAGWVARFLAAMGLAGRRDAAQVLRAPGVDLHDVPLVEEERHLDDGPALERGRLGAARGRVTADARVGLGDRELHERRQLDRHRAAVDEEDVDVGIFLEEVARVADLLRRQRDLVVGLRIHEVIAVVLVEVLHVLVLEVDQLHFFAGAERVVDDAPLPHVLELGAHEGAALAGLDVLEIDDGVWLPIELDLEALLELCRGHLHDVMAPSVSGSWPAAPLRVGRRKICAASSWSPCSRHRAPMLIVANVSSASARPNGDPSPARPSAASVSSSRRDSRSPASSLTTRSRCIRASSSRPALRWMSAVRRCAWASFGLA